MEYRQQEQKEILAIAEQAYLNYLAAWVFYSLNTGLCGKRPAGFREWKRQNILV